MQKPTSVKAIRNHLPQLHTRSLWSFCQH